ncbi:hypothetical protein BCD64_01120 [Nostoc sp. MBR 210]|nr:hypothetical protein BCD64_01120 [Nostoc sp. MBR 210]
MLKLEGISSETPRISMWSDLFRSWMGLLIILGILLFGVTARIQFSCYPMVSGGNLPNFCNNQAIKEKIIEDPRTHENTLENIAANPNENSDTLTKIYNSSNQPVENNPQFRNYLLASNPKTSESVLLDLAESNDLEIIKRLLSNPSAMENSKVRNRLCTNSLVTQKLKTTCNSPPPKSCISNHARNIMVGVGVGLLALIAAPVLLPSSVIVGGTVVASSTVGLLGGATASVASTGLLEFITKC